MRKSKKMGGEFKDTAGTIKENSQIIAKNIVYTNEKLDNIKSDIDTIKKNSSSKLPIILAIITLLVTISGATVVGIADRLKLKKSEMGTAADKSGSKPEYTIYLYPEYSTFDITTKINMTATLNFEADAVNITAYLASGGEDTVALERKNAMEWQKKVEFTETGIHDIVVTAIAPNGEVIENSIQVEVVPISIDMDIIDQIFSP